MSTSYLDPVEIATLAANRLVATQYSNGVVIYQIDALTGKQSNKSYNTVRLAGVAYSLAWAATYFHGSPDLSTSLTQAADRAIAFLLFTCELQQNGYYVGEFSFESGPNSKGKLGASALLALAMILSPSHAIYRDPLKKLISTLLSAQSACGAFRSLIGASELGNQRYASGEAILALIRYYERTADDSVLPAVERAFPFYKNYFAHDPHPGLYLWHTDCWSRMAQLPQIAQQRRAEYGNFAETLAKDLAGRQIQVNPQRDPGNNAKANPDHEGGICFGGNPGVSTSLYMEALARVSGMLGREGRVEEAAAYAVQVQRALGFLKKLQVTQLEPHSLINPEWVLGGFRNNLRSKLIRMDNDQHVLTACLTLLEEQTASPICTAQH